MCHHFNVLWVLDIGVRTPWRWRSSAETCSSTWRTVLLCVLVVHMSVCKWIIDVNVSWQNIELRQMYWIYRLICWLWIANLLKAQIQTNVLPTWKKFRLKSSSRFLWTYVILTSGVEETPQRLPSYWRPPLKVNILTSREGKARVSLWF